MFLCSFYLEIHQNAFGGRATAGPTGVANSAPYPVRIKGKGQRGEEVGRDTRNKGGEG